jgi:7,8-dihydropterin-6-yl-methyl-4-(beta-D-ribofuranosyl)aminobenzene 5'-phosphate synthase
LLELETNMTDTIGRRDLLKRSAAFAAAMTGGFSCVELAGAAPIQAPTIDKLFRTCIG